VRRFELLFEVLEITADAEEFSKRYLVHLARAADLMDGAETVVRRLHEHFRLAIITNGLKEVQRPRLECSPIAVFFEDVFISEEIGAAKPDPRFFEAVFARIGNPTREKVLVIGDSLTSDIQGGNLFGLDTCWFNPHRKPAAAQFPATYEIQALSQLPGLLETLP